MPGTGFSPVTVTPVTPTQAPQNIPVATTMDPLPNGQTLSQTVPTIQSQPTTTNPNGTTTPQPDNQTQAVLQLLADETRYQPNPLNVIRNPAYHFRLYMTTEHDLFSGTGAGASSGTPSTTATNASQSSTTTSNPGNASSTTTSSGMTIDQIYATLDSIPQVTIAESGVTAGFNIKSVEMNQSMSPGWRNKSYNLTSLSIEIVEPLGTSLLESIIDASDTLGVQNFAKFWYYLELSFVGYNEDGSINTSIFANNPNFNLINKGRWIWPIMINTMNMHMDEAGAQYKLDCNLYTESAFDDQTGNGNTPDSMNVSGSTIGEFLNNFAINLNAQWKKRYLGTIFTYSFKIHPLNGLTKTSVTTDPSAYKLVSSKPDNDPQTLNLTAGANNVPTANIPKDASIHEVVTFLYAHCEEAQKMMVGTKSGDLEDNPQTNDPGATTAGIDVTFDGKPYRVPITLTIEPDAQIVGYDPITNQYMKNFTYHIRGHTTYSVNISPGQFANSKNQATVVQMLNEMKQNGYLNKQYQYRYTGLNTEIIKIDTDFNFAFAAIVPEISGWRTGWQNVSVHAKYNEDANVTQSSFAAKPNEVSRGTPTTLSTAQANKVSSVAAQIATAQNLTNKAIADKQAIINDPTQTNANKQQAQADINTLNKQLDNNLTVDSTLIRNISNKQAQARTAAIEGQGASNTFAEDLVTANPSSFNITYIQGHNDSEDAAGLGFTGQWHRGKSLVGAVLNQLYQPKSNAMIQIELEIRGDPYWIGYSNLERKVINNGGYTPTPSSILPNIPEGDSTLALIFRFPTTIGQDGTPSFRSDDNFTGAYRVMTVQHIFSGGEFRQILSCVKLELINTISPTSGTTTTTAGTSTNTPSNLNTSSSSSPVASPNT